MKISIAFTTIEVYRLGDIRQQLAADMIADMIEEMDRSIISAARGPDED